MLGAIEITVLSWAGFVGCILFFLALDLGVFHKSAHVVKFREALGWTAVWVTLSLLFGLVLGPTFVHGWEKSDTTDFVTGYLIEVSLSLDNVFIIALIFSYFRVPLQFQHRVLFWGILGALLMRGGLIAAGTAIIRQFSWTLYLFGAFLIFSGVKMLFANDEGVHPDKNPVVRFAKRFFPVTADFKGQNFTFRDQGKLLLTPLALVLLMVETTDLVFALDSIPAIFAITTKPFIVFTSNIFAILGLRSLYFVLAEAIGYFRYLKVGLSLVLVFIGVKMLLAPHGAQAGWFQIKIPSNVSLLIVGIIIATSIIVSIAAARRENRARGSNRKP